jgi:hypothetical protein
VPDAQTSPLFAEPPAESTGTPRWVRHRQRVRKEPLVLPFPDTADAQLPLFKRFNDEKLARAMIRYCDDTLERALKILADNRFNPLYRQRILEWIAVPLVPPAQLLDRFSFQALCLMAGLSEPDILREGVLKRFAPECLSGNCKTPRLK